MTAIPEKLWQIVVAFLVAKKTGQVILHIHDGHVLKLDVNESIRV